MLSIPVKLNRDLIAMFDRVEISGLYTAADPDEATKAFIEYMMSDDVQGELVEAQGYIPVSGMKVEKDASGKVTKK